MHYPDSVDYLYALGNEMKTAKMGLDRILALLGELQNPHLAFRVVHVAGTNGKGSTSAMIAAGLEASGSRTGLYTSPHLLEPTERIRLAGKDISKEAFLDAFHAVHSAAEGMLARGRLDAHPTYFETLTAMAFWAFAQAEMEWAVVEVGLGGRLDATNVVNPSLCVITPVDLDHESWLGHSIEQIAAEKAGIVKAGVPVLSALQRPEALAVIESRAGELGATLHTASAWRQGEVEMHPDGVAFTVYPPNPGGESHALRIYCPLRGAFQAANARTAVAALSLLGVGAEAIVEGIRGVRWPGRLEKLGSRPDLYLDGAHNPAGCAALAQYIREIKGDRRVWLVFGLMRDKAVSEMAGLLFPLADHLVLTAPRQPRALRPAVLAAESTGQPVMLAADIEEALDIVSAASPDDLVFVAGSLFLVAEAAAILRPPASDRTVVL